MTCPKCKYTFIEEVMPLCPNCGYDMSNDDLADYDEEEEYEEGS